MEKYFWAGGKRHELAVAGGKLAFDTRKAAEAGVASAVENLAITSKLPGGLTIVDRDSLRADVWLALESASLLHPVYTSGRALVVLLPEVRVEFDGDQKAATMQALSTSPVAAEVTGSSSDRLSLRPRSGSGADALDLANYIYEHAHPAASSVRMLQVVPKPAVTRDS
jgi:hypothetical protein